jgi:large subunit ribosomal protein L25
MKHQKEKIQLNAQLRPDAGVGLSKLRADGYIPGVLYGKAMDAIPLQILAKDFGKALKISGESTLVYIELDGKSYPTIIHDVARDPIRDTILHADFYKVRLDEKIKAMVPVQFEGEAPAVKDLGGIFVRNINELEVEALPQDLPHEVLVNISGLVQIGEHISVKDINLGDNVKITSNLDEIVALIQQPISEEQLAKDLEQTTVSVEDVEEIKKEKTEEATEEATAEDKKE